MRVTSSLTTALTPTVVALGNFDGVHRGHQQVICPIVQGSVAAQATVVSFNPHPKEFFSGQSWALLTPLAEKVEQLRALGVQQLVLLPFNRDLAALSPEAFVDQILVQQLQTKYISVGHDFRFGQKRAGTVADLQAIAARWSIEVSLVAPYTCEGGDRISSSLIRQALQAGDLQRANGWLGRAYSLVGQVVQGQQLGRTLGFPTANLQVPPDKFLPCTGVYAVRVVGRLSGVDNPVPLDGWPGVMNFGHRPTVNGIAQTIEIHLLDWGGDLYGQTLTVQLEYYLRPEQKFASLQALQTQIQADCTLARELLRQSSRQELPDQSVVSTNSSLHPTSYFP